MSSNNGTQIQIPVAAAALELKISEQKLRLALSSVRPLDFDTTKAITQSDLNHIAKTLEQQTQQQLPAQSQKSENAENPTQQGSGGATLKPQNSPIQGFEQQQQTATQNPLEAPQNLSLAEQIAKQSLSEIDALKGLLELRNLVAKNNLLAKDAELAESFQSQWQSKQYDYLSIAQDLANKAAEKPSRSNDEINLDAEIATLLGKFR